MFYSAHFYTALSIAKKNVLFYLCELNKKKTKREVIYIVAARAGI